MQWDIFCQVVDNFGDIGVCWRLACQLAGRQQQVRLWTDDATALAWMAPTCPDGVAVMQWDAANTVDRPGDVVIEAFGCDLPVGFVERIRATQAPHVLKRLWLNLEYLSAEAYAARSHLLPSPVMSGPGEGMVKYFFYPGFQPATGGLLREPDVMLRQQLFDPHTWLTKHKLQLPDASPAPLRVCLFSYEPPALASLLDVLERSPQAVHLLVTAGRASAAVQKAMSIRKDTKYLAVNPSYGNTHIHSSLSISYLPYLSHADFDHLLWSCDLNFVRGEDSLVRAIWAQKPFVWQLYPQDDGVHGAKLDAFLDTCGAGEHERRWYATWNGFDERPLEDLPSLLRQSQSAQLGMRLLAQADLVSQLLTFADQKTR